MRFLSVLVGGKENKGIKENGNFLHFTTCFTFDLCNLLYYSLTPADSRPDHTVCVAFACRILSFSTDEVTPNL